MVFPNCSLDLGDPTSHNGKLFSQMHVAIFLYWKSKNLTTKKKFKSEFKFKPEFKSAIFSLIFMLQS